jgi:peptidoglycan/xylan/chitin deacetylase (PgdA/CDA1 family)
MKIILLSLLPLFFFSNLSQAQALLAEEQDVLFSESQTFPMDRCMNVGGACRPGGLYPNQIALTFDDGPNENTLRILDILDDYNAKATFFVHVGLSTLSSRKASILNEIYRRGHKLANHGRSHSPLNGSTSINTVIDLLMDTHNALIPFTNDDDILVYRNPGGYWSGGRAHGLNQHSTLRNYVGPIFWNVGGSIQHGPDALSDAADWECNARGVSASRCAQGYINKIMDHWRRGSGSLVLMHDIHNLSVEMLPILLSNLQAIENATSGLQWDYIFVQDIPVVQSMRTEI